MRVSKLLLNATPHSFIYAVRHLGTHWAQILLRFRPSWRMLCTVPIGEFNSEAIFFTFICLFSITIFSTFSLLLSGPTSIGLPHFSASVCSLNQVSLRLPYSLQWHTRVIRPCTLLHNVYQPLMHCVRFSAFQCQKFYDRSILNCIDSK